MEASHATTISLQERDFALLKGLLESRVMTAGHVATLFFDDRREATKKRLQKLKAAGYIGERKRLTYEPAILFLTSKGLKLLKEHGTLNDYPPASLPALEKRARVSEFTLRHELEVMDVKAAVQAAMKMASGFSIVEFTTWTTLHQFKATPSKYDGNEVLIKPDGFIRIHEVEKDGGLSEHTFFLEVDRSTETLDTLVAKAASYHDYLKSGGFAERNNARRSDAKDFPFRVLIVFKTPERRNNFAERLLQNNPPIFSLTCLSTFDEVLKNSLGKVWFRPLDYRDAVKGTPFDTKDGRQQLGYQRQTARDVFIEKNLVKVRLLVDETTN
jgi:hypothetical protein